MDYRERIYGNYVTARRDHLAPDTVAGFAPRAPYLRKLIRDHFPKDRAARIVELGCGHGALLYFAKEMGYSDVIGVDRSPEQLSAARNLGIAVMEGDLMHVLRDMRAATVTSVVAFDVLEHFTKPEAVAFVDEVARVLSPGGAFIVHAPNGESPMVGAVLHGDFTHETCFTAVSIAQLLKASGFSSVRCFEDAPIAHGLKSATRWALWKVIRTAMRFITATETGDIGRKAILTRNFLTVATK